MDGDHPHAHGTKGGRRGGAREAPLGSVNDGRRRAPTRSDLRRVTERAGFPTAGGAIANAGCAPDHSRTHALTHSRTHRFTYLFANPFRVFVTVNDPSARAEILM